MLDHTAEYESELPLSKWNNNAECLRWRFRRVASGTAEIIIEWWRNRQQGSTWLRDAIRLSRKEGENRVKYWADDAYAAKLLNRSSVALTAEGQQSTSGCRQINLVRPCHIRRLSVPFVTSSTACRHGHNAAAAAASGHRAAVALTQTVSAPGASVTLSVDEISTTTAARRRARWDRRRVTSPTWPETYLLVVGAIDASSCDRLGRERGGPTTDCRTPGHPPSADSRLRSRKDATSR